MKFTVIMTIIAGLILAGMFYATEPIAKKNAAVFKKRAILSSISSMLDKPLKQMSDDEVIALFTEKMEQKVLNMKGEAVEGSAENLSMAAEAKLKEADRKLPIFIYNSKDGTVNIVGVYGNGLWDKIWGYVALKSDNKTIAGTSFDHRGETPGLGAEIKDDPTFAYRFIGKTILDDAGKYTSVSVMKKVTDGDHQVDGIGGATLTGDGVTEMMVRGIEYYLPYFQKNKN